MSYSILKKPVALAGMDPLTCISRGGTPMPTPVPWGYGIDVDCQLPGEPPQAAQCRSYGGMWYRELGLCIPGMIPGGIPSFPATPYAPAPPANPYDQVAAQVCTATGGHYAGGICNYPQLGVTRTRSQLVDSEYDPPAGWTPPAGGCPQGQVGWPPVCVPVPNTLPSIPTTPAACPAGTVWDAASGKCIAPAQLPPPGESESEKQVAPAAPAEEKKLPSWVLPAVAGGAAFVILAALAMRRPREMRANAGEPSARLSRLLERARRASLVAHRPPPRLSKEQLAELHSRAGLAHSEAATQAWGEGLADIARRHEAAWERHGKRGQKLRDLYYSEHSVPMPWERNACRMRRNPPVELSYDDPIETTRSLQGKRLEYEAGELAALAAAIEERTAPDYHKSFRLFRQSAAKWRSAAEYAETESAMKYRLGAAAAADARAEQARNHVESALHRSWMVNGRRSMRARRNPAVELSYADLNVFQRYWWGQWDPLYAVLSRRGNSVGWVWVDASEEELERLTDVANEIIEKSDDKGEVRTAKAFLKRQK